MVGLGRFELPTPRLSSVCSDQLSYRPDSRLSLTATALQSDDTKLNPLDEKAGQMFTSSVNPDQSSELLSSILNLAIETAVFA